MVVVEEGPGKAEGPAPMAAIWEGVLRRWVAWGLFILRRIGAIGWVSIVEVRGESAGFGSRA